MNQTVPPTKWIIVDDGSTDETAQIVSEYSARYSFIQLIRKGDRGRRSVGPGVIDAFYTGLAHVDFDDYDYICKFDGDLEVPLHYFERLMEFMEADPWLGNISGKLFERRPTGRLVEERTGDENAVGAAKFYRLTCFNEIGGVVRDISWDGIDGHMCRMKGWIASSVSAPDLRIIHLRPMGSSQQNIWVGRLRWGRGKYFMGSSWYYMLAASAYRMFERPWVIGGIGIALGFVRAALTGQEQYGDDDYRRFLRRYELESLLHGRRRTLHKYNDEIRNRWPRGSVS